MSVEREIHVQLFGAFRDLVPSGNLVIIASDDQPVAAIKENLGHKLAECAAARFDVAALLSRSALATETRVLAEGDTLRGTTAVAVLPPVCGG
jgi:molybdopterin converting factor small subunit